MHISSIKVNIKFKFFLPFFSALNFYVLVLSQMLFHLISDFVLVSPFNGMKVEWYEI